MDGGQQPVEFFGCAAGDYKVVNATAFQFQWRKDNYKTVFPLPGQFLWRQDIIVMNQGPFQSLLMS